MTGSISIEYTIVDAFASGHLRGNPAAVVILDSPRSPEWMQRVASELAQPATAFVERVRPRLGLRWCTPTTELQLCGHGTLAAGCVVLRQTGLEVVRFSTPGGDADVSVAGELFELEFPRRLYEPATNHQLAAALGVVDVATGVSGDDWLMEVATPEEVVDCTPDLSRVERLARSAVITAPGGEDAAITSRVFAPAIGIPEDQVTGSAHSGLATWWNARLGSDFYAYQASARGGRIRLRLSEHGVRLAGRAEIVGSGFLAR